MALTSWLGSLLFPTDKHISGTKGWRWRSLRELNLYPIGREHVHGYQLKLKHLL
ncbi:hypothetical protein [Coleofasciculus sp. E1-EBD-02]|uniref:hypothetical protein n=1 Tax=Coleofasciculus sp. E1-EBD-02 TaxID=3068481 RepID=UPI0032F9C7EB